MAKIAVTPAIVSAEFILFSKKISRQKVTLHQPIYEFIEFVEIRLCSNFDLMGSLYKIVPSMYLFY